jgi:tartrate-resistant acid phosphatase type 5
MFMDRRRALKTVFCFSAFAAFRPRYSMAATKPSGDAIHLMAIGDFGTTGKVQLKVAGAMADFMKQHKLTPKEMLLLGDNFYGLDKDGFSIESNRWRKTFEDVYPESDFPMRCPAVLGNHDYHDNDGGEQIQLQYAREKKTRFTLPNKWYRYELGPNDREPWLTVIALDSNVPEVSGGLKNKKPKACLGAEEVKMQQEWLESELQKPRAPMTLVLGHHPLYSNGDHGDTEVFITRWGELFQKQRVHAYLCGHDHDLQHLELEGKFTSFVLSGGGGAKIRELEDDRKMPFGKSVNGFTHLEVMKNALRFSHYDTDGQCLHQFQKKLDGSVDIAE